MGFGFLVSDLPHAAEGVVHTTGVKFQRVHPLGGELSASLHRRCWLPAAKRLPPRAAAAVAAAEHSAATDARTVAEGQRMRTDLESKYSGLSLTIRV